MVGAAPRVLTNRKRANGKMAFERRHRRALNRAALGRRHEGDTFDLALAVQRVEDWEETTSEAVQLAERDRDYYDNKQLDSRGKESPERSRSA